MKKDMKRVSFGHVPAVKVYDALKKFSKGYAKRKDARGTSLATGWLLVTEDEVAVCQAFNDLASRVTLGVGSPFVPAGLYAFDFEPGRSKKMYEAVGDSILHIELSEDGGLVCAAALDGDGCSIRFDVHVDPLPPPRAEQLARSDVRGEPLAVCENSDFLIGIQAFSKEAMAVFIPAGDALVVANVACGQCLYLTRVPAAIYPAFVEPVGVDASALKAALKRPLRGAIELLSFGDKLSISSVDTGERISLPCKSSHDYRKVVSGVDAELLSADTSALKIALKQLAPFMSLDADKCPKDSVGIWLKDKTTAVVYRIEPVQDSRMTRPRSNLSERADVTLPDCHVSAAGRVFSVQAKFLAGLPEEGRATFYGALKPDGDGILAKGWAGERACFFVQPDIRWWPKPECLFA